MFFSIVAAVLVVNLVLVHTMSVAHLRSGDLSAKMNELTSSNFSLSQSSVSSNQDNFGATDVLAGDQTKFRTFNRPGCGPEIPSDTRLMLMDIVPKFHGSTSLAGVLMSSPHVTTLCSANVWECEGDQIIGMDPAVPRLWKFGEIWDLDKSVFLEKGPRRLEKTMSERGQLVWERRHLPEVYVSHGINTISLAYIIMFRPICLSWLSHNAKDSMDHDEIGFVREELAMLEEAVTTHQMLTRGDAPVLIVNIADMMWRSWRSQESLEHFLPCVGPLDFDYVPVLGKDIFEGNEWKMAGSIKSFGESVDPQACCKYNIETSRCEAESGLFSLLSPEEQERAERAHTYLVEHS